MKLFQPKPSYKFSSILTESQVPGMGQNPLEGVIIDYFLPWNMDEKELTLEILEANGELIRKYSNQKPLEAESYEGGPPKIKEMPSRKGVNRFNWDLRRATLSPIPGLFINGEYEGSHVGPGEYTIKLYSETDTVTQTCIISSGSKITS